MTSVVEPELPLTQPSDAPRTTEGAGAPWGLALLVIASLAITAFTIWLKCQAMLSWRYTSDMFIVDTMLTEELRLRLDLPTPLRAASITFVCFLAAGVVPLVPLHLLAGRTPFLGSALATGATFAAIGAIQGKLTSTSPWRSALTTLLLGGCAALLAYAVGAGARHLGG